MNGRLLAYLSVTCSSAWEEGLRTISAVLPAHIVEAGALAHQGERIPVRIGGIIPQCYWALLSPSSLTDVMTRSLLGTSGLYVCRPSKQRQGTRLSQTRSRRSSLLPVEGRVL
jgi:hypothetical protein